MKTDRELLELAAKAIGVEVEWRGGDHFGYYGEWKGLPQWEEWNPLTDDGDALRLLVKLGEGFPCVMLGIYGRADFPHIGSSIVHKEGGETYVEQEYGDDINAATRRAVVRAAAEIGAAMA